MLKRDKLVERITLLEKELERKNAVLELYAHHRNWVKPSEVRERLNIPEVDAAGKPIDEPLQCFVGARYAWEPALKVMVNLEE
jgi:hypothetical protein